MKSNNKEEAKVSIIVPIYNVEKYLKKCLDSLINQTFKEIEIWAISDGSPDNSVSIIKEYSSHDSRVKCIEKENGGYGSVLEYAIKNITTPYFLICDPDDWLKEDAIEVLYKKATTNNLDMVVGSKYLVYNDNSEEVYDKSKFDGCNCIPNRTYSITNEFYFLQPSPHSKLYKTKRCKNIKFPKKVSFTDYLLYLLALENANRVMYLEDALSYYLVDRPGNSMTDTKEKVFEDHKIVLESVLKQIEPKYNKVIYARLFFQYRNVLLFLNQTASIETKKKYSKEYLDLLDLLIPYKKYILKYYPNLTLKNRIYFSLLLNKKFKKILFYRILKLER